jgi:23S rRNA G2069 N7-methylase RlmK/C1962 C5-methylase RlmI
MMSRDLESAWARRLELRLFEGTEALRVFHGPGEGSGALRDWAIDRFGDHYWVTRWEDQGTGSLGAASDAAVLDAIVAFLRSKGAVSVVWLGRPEKGVPAPPRALWGEAPVGRFEVGEGHARYWIQLLETRHPGLFLDHAPLRAWLAENARGWSVLNTFAYTGSLSVACGLGGASHVTTLDLSRPTVQWAEANWALNGLEAPSGADGAARFVFGDVFEWMPRLKREGQRFDCVILDPPSFSRGQKGKGGKSATFSTAKDLRRLHELAMDLLVDQGTLITSINSANVSWDKYESDVQAAAREKRIELRVVRKIALPESFPAKGDDAYLKGWIFKARRRH